MKAYYCTGRNGSILQIDDGRWADTVSGEMYEDSPFSDAHEALELLDAWLDECEVEWMPTPLYGDFTEEQMVEYVGA